MTPMAPASCSPYELPGCPRWALRGLAHLLWMFLAILPLAAALPWSTAPTRARFEHLGPAQGLSQGTVFCALQDRQGFLWFGTEDGLNRFDGLRFKVYRGREGRDGLRGNWITSLMEDREGRLWIGSMGGGLHRLDRARDVIAHVSLGESGSFSDIRALVQDPTGALWVGTYGRGLFRVVPRVDGGADVVGLPTLEGPRFANIQALHCDARGQVWAGAVDGGLARIEATGDTWRMVPVSLGPGAPTELTAIAPDGEDRLWLASSQGLFLAWPREGRYLRFTHEPGRPDGLGATLIRALYRDRVGVLWVGTDGGGLHRMWNRSRPEETPRFQRFQSDPRDPGSLATNAVECILEDRSGVLWVGCYVGGLNRLVLRQGAREDREQRPVRQWVHNPADPGSLSGSSVNAVLEDRRGQLWVGTEGAGLNRARPRTGPQAPVAFEAFRAGGPAGLKDDVFLCLFEDRQGRLWGGTYQGGLVEIRQPEGRPTFRHHRHQPGRLDSLPSNFVTSLADRREGGLWVGTVDGGLSHFDPATGKFIPVVQQEEGANSVYAIREDSHGTLWLGTLNGLARFHPGTGELKVIQAQPGEGRLGHPNVFSLHLDGTGMLWVGTGGGLYCMTVPAWDGPAPVFRRFGREAGLPSEVVRSILEDGLGGLMVTTSRSLCRFDPRNGQARSLGWHRELEEGEFMRNAAFRTPRGEVLLGGTRGLLAFLPGEMTYHPVRPPVMFTDLLLFNHPVPVGAGVLDQAIGETRELVLRHQDYVVSLEFAALHFVAPERNTYAYRMEGLETEWNEVGNRRHITYTTLPPGTYRLRVRAANCDGLWNEEGATLAIRVLPPWWGTWWARISLGVLLVAGTALAFRLRVRALAAQNHLLEHRVLERTRDLALANERLQEADRLKERMTAMLIHDLRSPLSGIQSALDLMEEEQRLDKRLMASCRHSLTSLLGILEDILLVFRSQERSLVIDDELIHLPTWLERVHAAHLAPMTKRGVRFDLSAPPDLPALLGDRRKLERVLGNLLGNAMKFTPRDGWVRLEARAGHREIVLRVVDTGRGIPDAELPRIFDPYHQVAAGDGHHGAGLGLAIVKRIVEAHGGRVVVESQEGHGTTFSLHLPSAEVGGS